MQANNNDFISETNLIRIRLVFIYLQLYRTKLKEKQMSILSFRGWGWGIMCNIEYLNKRENDECH
jgi:hypothetical protein